MSKIAFTPNASGTGTFSIASPGTNTDRTLTLPDATTTLVGTNVTQTLTNKSIAATQLTGDVAAARITTALNATGSAPIYACRAWVNFDGTGTVAIRASGNVSSITDNGVGNYTVNFTTAMPDANYCAVGSSTLNSSTNTKGVWSAQSYATTSLGIVCSAAVSGYVVSSTNADHPFVNVAIFR
jgi:hypothetical protein